MWFDKQSFTLKSCRGSMYKHNFIEALTEVFQNTSSSGVFGSQYLRNLGRGTLAIIETSFIAKHLSVYKLFHPQTHQDVLAIDSLSCK